MLREKSQRQFLKLESDQGTNLQGVLAREALLAVAARERLDSQVDALVALQIVVAVETLSALVALEGAVVLLLLVLLLLVPVHVLPAHLVRVLHAHAANERHLIARVMHVGHDGACHGWQAVPVVRARVVTAHRRVVSGDGRESRSLGVIGGLLRWGVRREGRLLGRRRGRAIVGVGGRRAATVRIRRERRTRRRLGAQDAVANRRGLASLMGGEIWQILMRSARRAHRGREGRETEVVRGRWEASRGRARAPVREAHAW